MPCCARVDRLVEVRPARRRASISPADRREVAGDDLDQRRLAGAVVAHQADDLARLERRGRRPFSAWMAPKCLEILLSSRTATDPPLRAASALAAIFFARLSPGCETLGVRLRLSSGNPACLPDRATARGRYILASMERQYRGNTLTEFLRDMVRENSVRLPASIRDT